MVLDIFMSLELAVIGLMLFILMVMVGHAINSIEIEVDDDANDVGSGQTGQKAD